MVKATKISDLPAESILWQVGMRTPLMIITRTVAKIKAKTKIKLRKLQMPESFIL